MFLCQKFCWWSGGSHYYASNVAKISTEDDVDGDGGGTATHKENEVAKLGDDLPQDAGNA